jgi:hypothetical protein
LALGIEVVGLSRFFAFKFKVTPCFFGQYIELAGAVSGLVTAVSFFLKVL